MMHNIPNLDLENIDVHTKFGQILSIGSQDIEEKRSDHRRTEPWNHRTKEGQGKFSIAPLFQSQAIITIRENFVCLTGRQLFSC